ncbi:pentatricopeptide repeat-containing protein At4g18520, chloroplastic-like isoform X2 [Selaginella moellendorffii]|uniref:pentatricopeptide repeat-containing protein At4g18520, chloroplastic-like isoform X2 n=1 Tax=Selaginella moellendorffii TaxID=88036 RepID=UPI000D1CD1B7|nr:pentatricopeptide repeat-containing protein At4g18520, chloroplastic-like isoform X2 [Selaginella moellendorffii]|eukprot:XP_024517895.1 pentatricopeptide repeat-containing protein At4g18520, chloroplastic-like isoform X2 [Selaginella moellendorffii]
MYSKCGSMVEARRVFDGLERNTHDAVSWTALMFGYVENKQELQALELFVSMAKVCRPNARAFVVALKACTRVAANEGGKVVAGDTIVKVRALENGMEIHRRAATDGFDKNTIVSNAVVEMYAQCGSLVDARAVLDRMVEHDEASWNALLLGYSQSGEQELALELFELLSSSGRSGGRPAYAAALKCCAELAAKEDGRTVDGKLVKLGSLGKVMRIHSQAVKIELDSDRFLASALVDTYAKCGSVLDARRVFDSMVLEGQDDLVLWTSIMLAHADNGEGRVTLELFSRIKSQPWWSPRDPQTMVAALKASGSSEVASLESARRIHAEACRHGLIERDEALASCLVDAYGRLGRSGDSQQPRGRSGARLSLVSQDGRREDHPGRHRLRVRARGLQPRRPRRQRPGVCTRDGGEVWDQARHPALLVRDRHAGASKPAGRRSGDGGDDAGGSKCGDLDDAAGRLRQVEERDAGEDRV